MLKISVIKFIGFCSLYNVCTLQVIKSMFLCKIWTFNNHTKYFLNSYLKNDYQDFIDISIGKLE
jgi:hypothetical protein